MHELLCCAVLCCAVVPLRKDRVVLCCAVVLLRKDRVRYTPVQLCCCGLHGRGAALCLPWPAGYLVQQR